LGEAIRNDRESVTVIRERDVVALFVDNLWRFVAGEPLRNVVDVELGYAPGGR
jgi:hypothetical protein